MNPICKYCKLELNKKFPNRLKAINKDGYYYACDKSTDNDGGHVAMDNLTLIEHLAKKRKLV